MASYLEIKKMLCELILGKKDRDIDEEEDIIIPLSDNRFYDSQTKSVTIENDRIKESFEQMRQKQSENMQLYTKDYYEVAVTGRWINGRELQIEDTVNGVNYYLGRASLEYVLMMCEQICDDASIKQNIIRIRYPANRLIERDGITAEGIIGSVLRINTIRIKSIYENNLISFKKYCSSFEYLYMYKTRFSIFKISNLSDIYERNGGGRARISELSEPPRRLVNEETLEYYSMGVDADDPFTKYISFYHVLEYYFDEAYKNKLICEMKNKLTEPSFSYKSEKKIYELAVWIGNRIKVDVEDGRGNELDSLKYVLEEYVDINELATAIDEWNCSLRDYYGTTPVTFTGSKNGVIPWSDREGVYTSLAKRIYCTRNALVHSKSGQAEKQYKPRKHKAILNKEIPLIQLISETIIFKAGDVL